LNELTAAIGRVQQGETAAFATIIDYFQDMAVGYAYAALGDRAVAEDVAQEAFIVAYFNLAALREPAAFPGWFRRIVQTQIKRVKRQRTPQTVPLAEAETLSAPEGELYPMLERQLFADQVAQAIQELPASQREVITLGLLRLEGKAGGH
jgi:RNA polymerase sigma factor (sigma-70 family)